MLENLNTKKRNTYPLVDGKDGPLEVVIEKTKFVFLSREHKTEISHYMKTTKKFFENVRSKLHALRNSGKIQALSAPFRPEYFVLPFAI